MTVGAGGEGLYDRPQPSSRLGRWRRIEWGTPTTTLRPLRSRRLTSLTVVWPEWLNTATWSFDTGVGSGLTLSPSRVIDSRNRRIQQRDEVLPRKRTFLGVVDILPEEWVLLGSYPGILWKDVPPSSEEGVLESDGHIVGTLCNIVWYHFRFLNQNFLSNFQPPRKTKFRFLLLSFSKWGTWRGWCHTGPLPPLPFSLRNLWQSFVKVREKK